LTKKKRGKTWNPLRPSALESQRWAPGGYAGAGAGERGLAEAVSATLTAAVATLAMVAALMAVSFRPPKPRVALFLDLPLPHLLPSL